MFWVNGSLAHFFWATWANRSFLVSEMSDSLTLLIWFDWNEQFAHGRSFVLSVLSESLTVAHLIWAKWANEQWVNEEITSPAIGFSFPAICQREEHQCEEIIFFATHSLSTPKQLFIGKNTKMKKWSLQQMRGPIGSPFPAMGHRN